jgi:phospholipase B1
MAIGDSITAGFAMKSGPLPFTQITEFRGSVFAIGGDAGETTIPNILRRYNTNLQGAATGTTALRATIDVLNAAVSGALVSDLPGQVATLAKAYNSDPVYNKNGWKMINVLIGANNVCNYCQANTGNLHSADAFEGFFRTTLQSLRGNFTDKTIVNAVQLFNVSQVFEPQQTRYCRFAQGILNLCPCINQPAQRQAMDNLTAEYNRRITKVAAEFQFPNFAVNVQPGFTGISLQTAGINFLSRLDCFHPNQCANQATTAMLWNNLFQAPANKVRNYQLTQANNFYCPGPNDYFA